MDSIQQDDSVKINLEAEDEHFRVADSIISWMENCKSLKDDNPEVSLQKILPPPAQPLLDDYHASAPGLAWNLVRIFRMKKLKHLVDIRRQLYYLKIYISTCPQCETLSSEYTTLNEQHMLQGDVHSYTLNNLVDKHNGKLYDYLNDLVNRSTTHVANCDRCRAKGHYCQLCGPSSLMSSIILSNTTNINNHSNSSCASTIGHQSSGLGSVSGTTARLGPPLSATGSSQTTPVTNYHNMNHSSHQQPQMPNPNSFGSASNTSLASLKTIHYDHELLFPFEIDKVAQCHACGCCFHLQCFIDAGQNCPKCERIQRRKAEESNSQLQQAYDSGLDDHQHRNGTSTSSEVIATNMLEITTETSHSNV